MRRSLFGYRPPDVHRVVGELEADVGAKVAGLRSRDAEIKRLTAEIGTLGALDAQHEGEIAALRGELERARADVEQELRGLAALGLQLQELRVSARGQATRIRLRALREAAELSVRMAAIGDGAGAGERLTDALEAAIDRVAGEWDDPEPEAGRADARPSRLADTNEPCEAPPRVEAPPLGIASAPEPVGRHLTLDIGPFHDFSQLVSFEDAANAIGATAEISIKRFSEGRAQIDVALSEPVDLLRELEQRCDLELRVRSREGDGIVLDLGE